MQTIDALTKKIEMLSEKQAKNEEDSKEWPLGIKRLND